MTLLPVALCAATQIHISPTGNDTSTGLLIPQTAKFIQNLTSGVPQKIVLYGTSLTAEGPWVSQLQTAVQSAYPSLATWVNSGGSGKASDWGLANLQTKVISQNPDAVFIEFSMNDAATTLGISRAQAVANLDAMVDAIRAARPDCEIILQIMNPRDFQPGDSYDPRLQLELYQQDCRDYATANGLQFIDHMPAWRMLLDKGSPAFRIHVPDGVHPNATGTSLFLTPVLLHALGLPTAAAAAVPDLIIDNTNAAPEFVTNGTWTVSTYAEASPNVPYNGNVLHDGNTDKGSKTAIFTPSIPTAGTYPVFLRWVSATNRASNVPVTVNFSGGSQTFLVNQRLSGGTWHKLGDFPFAAGSTGNVTIATTGTNGYVIADAMGIGTSLVTSPPEIRLRMDNRRLAEPATPAGAPRGSTITAWLAQPATQALTIHLDTNGGTATSGTDYQPLPATLSIPAGKTSASIDLIPLYDGAEETEERFQIKVLPHADYTLGSPVEANVIIEASAASPPPTFASWIGGFGLLPADQDLTDDPDADGVPNGIEHVLGSNPNSYTAGLAQTSSIPTSISFQHALNPLMSDDVTYGYQFSTNLVEWLASGVTSSGGTRATITSSSPDVNQRVTVVIAITDGPSAMLFGRLSTTNVP